jgi:hypothetical protein
MNMVMAGMIPAMVMLMMGEDMRAMDPRELVYWGAMSASIAVGFALALPVNVWLVNAGLKHGMGTQRKKTGKGTDGAHGGERKARGDAGMDHSKMSHGAHG